MTSYLPPSDDVSKIFMAFERFCPREPSWPSLVVIGPQIKEKQRGAQCAPLPAYIVPKDPSLNRVKVDINNHKTALNGRISTIFSTSRYRLMYLNKKFHHEFFLVIKFKSQLSEWTSK